MSLETDADPIDVEEAPISLPFPIASWGRILYGLFVTVLPIFSFWATDLLKPEWQNGELSSYIILLLFPQASILFLLLISYSIISYLLLLVEPHKYSQSFVVRFGIYTGALLALQYSVTLLLFSFDSFIVVLILIWILPIVISRGFRWSQEKWGVHIVKKMSIVLVAIALLVSVIVSVSIFPFWILIGLVMAAPFWSFLLALRAGVWLYKNHETTLTSSRGLGLAAWIATYIAAWRYDILKMYEFYAALPPQPPPDCYIATAAAQGHPRVVGSRLIQRTDGRSMQVNGQLQVLKFAELALLAVSPRLHIFLRRIYDVVGKVLARRIRHPFLADIAYLLLKPFEWLARWLLKMIVPDVDALTEKIYTE